MTAMTPKAPSGAPKGKPKQLIPAHEAYKLVHHVKVLEEDKIAAIIKRWRERSLQAAIDQIDDAIARHNYATVVGLTIPASKLDILEPVVKPLTDLGYVVEERWAGRDVAPGNGAYRQTKDPRGGP